MVASRRKGHEVSSTFADTVTDPPVNVLKGDQSTAPWEIISSLLHSKACQDVPIDINLILFMFVLYST